MNPIAIELGAISLWLNGLHASDFSPWFGDQLHAGNSLIGARRASYSPALMSAKKKADLWFNDKPTEIGWTGSLPKGHIWQWLLPAKDMAKFDTDKSIAEFAGRRPGKDQSLGVSQRIPRSICPCRTSPCPWQATAVGGAGLRVASPSNQSRSACRQTKDRRKIRAHQGRRIRCAAGSDERVTGVKLVPKPR